MCQIFLIDFETPGPSCISFNNPASVDAENKINRMDINFGKIGPKILGRI